MLRISYVKCPKVFVRRLIWPVQRKLAQIEDKQKISSLGFLEAMDHLLIRFSMSASIIEQTCLLNTDHRVNKYVVFGLHGPTYLQHNVQYSMFGM